MASMVCTYSNEKAIEYLNDLIQEIKCGKILVTEASRHSKCGTTTCCVPTGYVTLEYTVLPDK